MKLKLISIFLVMVYVSSLFAVHADNVNTVPDEKIEFLTAMGFMNNLSDNNFGGNSSFTRADLAQLACKISNLAPADVTEDESLFYDLTSSHSQYGYIKTAVANKLMAGYDDGKFRPDETATFEQACKVFSIVAGYGIYGHTASYYETATKIGITKGAGAGGKLTKGLAAVMAYNTLHANYLKQTGFSDNLNFETEKGYTVLEKYFDILYDNGIVSGVKGTMLSRPISSLDEDELLIDNVVYTDAPKGDFLGLNVKYYYYKSEEEKRKLAYIQIGKNDILTLNQSQIDDCRDGVITYIENENDVNTKKITLNYDTDVIYNGAAYPIYTDSDFLVDSGFVRFIDNDNDGEYEVAVIKSYEFLLVGYVDTENKIIFDKYDADKRLDLGQQNTDVSIYKSDQLIGMEKIRMNSLLAISQSKNQTGRIITEVNVALQKISGEILELSDDNISIGSQSYKISKLLKDKKNDWKVGQYITLYIWNDEAVMTDTGDKLSETAAYLVDVKFENKLSSKAEFKLVEKKAKFSIYSGAKKIKIDGTVCEGKDKVLNALSQTANLSNVSMQFPFSQPICFKLNSSDEICEIDTGFYDINKENETSLLRSEPYSTGVQRYYSVNKSFYPDGTRQIKCTDTNTTQVFWIPNDQRDSEDFYNVVTNGSGFVDNATYNIEAFNLEDNYAANIIFVYLNVIKNVASDAYPVIVTKITEVSDEGENVKKITYLNNGKEGQIKLINGYSYPTVKEGDAIRFRTNYDGCATVIDKVFDPLVVPDKSQRVTEYNLPSSKPSFEAGYRSVYGTILMRENQIITHSTSIKSDAGGIEAKENLDNYIADSNTCFYVYDGKNRNNKVRTAGFMDIIPYSTDKINPSEAFIYTDSGQTKMVYIVLK